MLKGLTGGGGGLTPGTTLIIGGVNGRLLFDNNGVLGEATVTYLANTLKIGLDAAAPAPQSIIGPNVTAGTSNTAGANITLIASQGTGTGLGGSWIFQVSPAGTTGSTQNAPATALTIDSTKTATFAANINVNGASPITNSSAFKTLAAGDGTFIVNAATGKVALYNNGVLGFTPDGGVSTGSALDIGVSRVGAGVMALGNGTALDTTGQLNLTRVKTNAVLVGALGSAATAGVGARAFVSDATVPVFGSTVSGSGAVPVPVYSDGTNWIVG